jgi:hypothetical protein
VVLPDFRDQKLKSGKALTQRVQRCREEQGVCSSRIRSAGQMQTQDPMKVDRAVSDGRPTATPECGRYNR